MPKANPVPTGLEGATPYLCCKGAAKAIDFYKKAFGATETMRVGDENMVGHAELKIGPAIIMLADEFPQMGFLSPQTLKGSPVIIHIYVNNVDDVARRAVAAGAILRRPVEDQFYGDRSCQLEDPFGHLWAFATRLEDLSPAEIQKRAAAKFGPG